MLAPGPACRPQPRLLLLLETLLLLLLLLLLLRAPAGTGSDPAENPAQQVNGIVGGAVLFRLKLPPTAPVTRIEWFFRRGSSPETLIATFRDGNLERPGATGRFGQQLEMADNTTLRIRALEKEDSGVLSAHVLFATLEVHEETFRLSVFEPVPDPQIHHQVNSKTAEGCDVTLQCLGSEKGALHILWKRGDQLSVHEEGSDWNLLSDEGTALHVSWWPDSSDSTVTCLLSNPVDQKYVSLDLISICQSEGHPSKMWLLLLIVLAVVLAAILAAGLWKRKSSLGAVPLTTPEEKGSPEPQYAELQKKRSPPEGDDNQDPDPPSPCLEELPMVTATPGTVYAMLQPPLATTTLPGLGPTSTCVPCPSSVLG